MGSQLSAHLVHLILCISREMRLQTFVTTNTMKGPSGRHSSEHSLITHSMFLHRSADEWTVNMQTSFCTNNGNTSVK